MAGKSGGSLSSLLSGKRAGTTLIVGGVVLAAVAWLLVINTSRQARAAAARAAAQGVRQVYVLTAARDIPQFTAIQADAVAIKAFPAAFAPPGALGKVEDAVGKFAATTIARDQIVLTSQVSAERRTSNLSASIPPGKVAFWMPLPDLLVQSGGLQPGDRVDILLSLTLSVRGAPQGRGAGTEDVRGVSTQTTLQNVEVFFTGSANNADLPPDSATAAGAGQPADAGAARLNQGRQVSRVVAFLLDPQNAVLAKWVKDSGGTIDLVLRSDASPEPFNTESVTADTVIERFKFRVPEQWTLGR